MIKLRKEAKKELQVIKRKEIKNDNKINKHNRMNV